MPVTLTNMLTNKVQQIPTPTRSSFMFNGLAPGDYLLVNEGASSVNVVLWGRTYTVPANTNWRFMVHGELENIGRGAIQAPLPGTQRFPGPIASTKMSEWSKESATYSQQSPADERAADDGPLARDAKPAREPAREVSPRETSREATREDKADTTRAGPPTPRAPAPTTTPPARRKNENKE